MSSYLTSTQRIINLPNDTAMNPAIYLMAVGGELLEPKPKLRQNAQTQTSKDHCNDTTEKQKNTQQIPELLGDGFVVQLAPLSCGDGGLKVVEEGERRGRLRLDGSFRRWG